MTEEYHLYQIFASRFGDVGAMWQVSGDTAFVIRVVLPGRGLDTVMVMGRAYPEASPWSGDHPADRQGAAEVRRLMAKAARQMIGYLSGEAMALDIPFAVAVRTENGAVRITPCIGDDLNGVSISQPGATPEGNGVRFGKKIDGLLGTFTLRVLKEACRIPRGKVITYGALARAAGVPGAARAVGNVMAGNPLPLIIPCHRVVRTGGYLGGYGGGTELKRFLLRNEGVRFDTNGRVIPE
jgi:O-6-methylguanine DNA methyltransferase